MKIGRFFKLIIINLKQQHRIRSLGVSVKAVEQSSCVRILAGSVVDKYSSIGSYTFIGNRSSITKSSIGRYCSIGNNVSIGHGEHSLDRVSTSALFYVNPWQELTKGECVIQDDVWVGVDAIVLRGVVVGTGAVIAANAVVTEDVPPFAIVGGVPAKVIRYRFDEQKRQQLIASGWWEKDFPEAKQLISSLD